ncbi:TetR/AcrR family transcriptional regulator [Rhizobium mayense]|uniref:TetR/AcrR family transcriptional regulator n=1 Tax=Rhizobium mayense TaxID=1312184 RepID=A0ABT7K641_9HYPH|nr:TetR/AcrR family transcriptional regulator [Rhizobium mayense]MDL2403637.1 TetR/AcrR family transcriptional regulator [Rhizobium mayense]
MARPRVFDESEVLDRAMEVFWRHGYEGASMAELTKAMGLNSPSIYMAFGSKRGLFDAVLKRYRERRAAHREAVMTASTAREAAERFLFGAIDWLVDPSEPRGCLTFQAGLVAGMNNDDVPRALIAHRQGTREMLAQRLERAKADGDLPPSADVAALAKFLFAVFSGLAIQAAEGLSKADLQETAALALRAWPASQRGEGDRCTV